MDIHPNGKTAYLIINKKARANNKDLYNVIVVELDLATRKVVRILREYIQDRDAPGPYGYCAIKCHAGGHLVIGLSMSISTGDVVAGLDVLLNTIPAFDPGSTNETLPMSVSLVDAEARATASAARAIANATASSITGVLDKLEKMGVKLANTTEMFTQLTEKLNKIALTIPSDAYIWQKAVDRIAAEIKALNTADSSAFESPIFRGYIKSIAQEVLLDAIEYAEKNPTKSALYKLIQSV